MGSLAENVIDYLNGCDIVILCSLDGLLDLLNTDAQVEDLSLLFQLFLTCPL